MFFSTLQQEKIKRIISSFSLKILEIKKRRFFIIHEYEENKKNNRIDIIKEKITKM